MTVAERVIRAAHNNAVWCDTVCATHGRPGVFEPTAWICAHPTPPFYPNIITLNPNALDTQRRAIELLRSTLPGPWAVKDSFGTLDPAPLGLTLLFGAYWLWRDADEPVHAPDSSLCWKVVRTGDELAAWEEAWRGEPDPSAGRTFLPALLADPRVATVAAHEDGRIVGGFIANHSGDVVGLSNLFTPTDHQDDAWAGAFSYIRHAFPGTPIVGYEHGDSLAVAQRFGFETIGLLRIYTY